MFHPTSPGLSRNSEQSGFKGSHKSGPKTKDSKEDPKQPKSKREAIRKW